MGGELFVASLGGCFMSNLVAAFQARGIEPKGLSATVSGTLDGTPPRFQKMTMAVLGCVVNGPGESKHANIGISLPGSGERPVAPVYVDGEKTVTLKGDRIAEEFQDIVADYVRSRFG